MGDDRPEEAESSGNRDNHPPSESSTVPVEANRQARYIGPYRILDTIGSGGMGTVYLAEQEKPVRRRVALKVIKLGMASEHVIARFEAERQALALMNHPNIAQVFDAGVTDEGSPYFAMEHAPGVPFTQYADMNSLSTRERLRLFISVCEAIHHAHQKGVIHRDIKPSNVLVTVQDGRPMVKVIDFGVAKAVQQKLTEKTLFTAEGVLIGTPEYMSPEQAEMTGLNVDTATDVYSLGVLLYEILTGVLPFDSKELRKGGLQSIHRILRGVDPPKPSSRISSMGDEVTQLALKRKVEPSSLIKEVRGELDWIVARAMEKDRSRRYPSASELAADVSRYLANEPVLARKPSTSYQIKKLVSRHKLEVASGALIAALLVGFGVWMSVLYARAQRAERIAATEARTANRASEFLVGLFEITNPSEARGNTVSAREIVDRGAKQIDRELSEDPIVQARLLNTLGEAYTGLGLYDEAEKTIDRALAIREESLGGNHLETANSLHSLSRVYTRQARYEEVEPLLLRAIAIKEETLGPDHPSLASSVNSLAAMHVDRLQFDKAESLYFRAIQIYERSGETAGLDHAISLMNLANLCRKQGRYEEADSLYQISLPIMEDAVGEQHPDVARTLNNIGVLYMRQGRYAQADSILEHCLKMRRILLGPDHPDVGYTLGNLALNARYQGEYQKAVDLGTEAIDIIEAALGPDHIAVSWALNDLGGAYYYQGRYDEAEIAMERSAEIKKAILGSDNADYALSLGNLASVIQSQGRLSEARTLMTRVLKIQEEKNGADHLHTANTLHNLGNLHRDLKEYDTADSYYGRSLSAFENSVGPDHPNIADCLIDRAYMYGFLGRMEESDALFERALAIREGAFGSESLPVTLAYYQWACACALSGHRAQAMQKLKESVDRGLTHGGMAEDPDLASLHGDPQFAALVATVDDRQPE